MQNPSRDRHPGVQKTKWTAFTGEFPMKGLTGYRLPDHVG